MSSRDLVDPRVQVAVELPSEPGAPGHEELQAIGSGEGRPDTPELAAAAWLSADEHRHGARLETVGLLVSAGHRELALLNVPTMLIEPAIRLLKELGTYVLAGGALEDGDIMQMRADLPTLIGVHDPDPDGDAALSVVFLA
jgi:hypothetical protein